MKKFKNISKTIRFFEIKGQSFAIKPGDITELDGDNKYIKTLEATGVLALVDENMETKEEKTAREKKAEDLEKKIKGEDKVEGKSKPAGEKSSDKKGK